MATASIELGRLLPGHQQDQCHCTDLVSKSLASVRGVLAARFVGGAAARFEVDYDPRLLNPEQLDTHARRAGEAARERYAHDQIRLAGLHCADCANKITAVTGRLDGVTSSSTSFTTEVLHVGYDRTRVSREQIAREVVGLGYKLAPEDRAGAAGAATTDPADAPAPRTSLTARLGVPADLFLSLIAGLGLLTGFILERLGAPTAAWLALYLVAYVAGGWHATDHAVRAARHRQFDIDILMVTAALGAATLGAWAEGALLLFLFSLGHGLERLAMDRARNAIRALADLTPKVARVSRHGHEHEIPVTELVVGDHVIVRPGERIPADGRVVAGSSMVDQAPITGESVPVLKEPGVEAFAGTINGAGVLELEATKGPEDTTLARVVKAVEGAQSAKAPSHRFTDRFQRVFTPVILLVTLLLIVVPPLFGVEFSASFMRAMTLLVAASPCALALATPSAVLSGIARAARSGVLIKGGAHLENAGTAKVVVFDKTGTLTEGSPSVTDVVAARGLEAETVLSLAAAVENRSSHPLAAAVVREFSGRAPSPAAAPEHVTHFEEVVGHGARGTVGGRLVLVGNRRFLTGSGALLPADLDASAQALEQDGKTVMFVGADLDAVTDPGATASVAARPQGQVARLSALGLIAVRDQPRPEARATVAALKQLGIRKVVMLSGDNRRVAEALGRELGLDEVRAELLPEEKASVIETLKNEYGSVVMVGDGINDAPALATADVGVAMGGAGSDVALETADIALMADDLSRLPYAIALSRASRRMIVQNLVIALAVIALLVPGSITGVATIGLAVVLHESSTLVVVLNALRLLGYKWSPGRTTLREPAAGV